MTRPIVDKRTRFSVWLANKILKLASPTYEELLMKYIKTGMLRAIQCDVCPRTVDVQYRGFTVDGHPIKTCPRHGLPKEVGEEFYTEDFPF